MSNWHATSDAVVAHIEAALHRDRDRKAVRQEDVPASVAAITPAWWTAVLCSSAPGAEVTGHRLLSDSAGTHHRHRFALDYNAAGRAAGQRAGLPATVFTKSLPTLVTRMIGGFNGTTRAEGRFYMEVRPHIDLEAPTGLHAAFDRDTFAGINVIEDIVTTRGATFCDHRTAVKRTMAESMIDTLGDLHGRTWRDARLDREWKWLPRFTDWFRVGSEKMETERYTLEAIDEAADAVPDAIRARRDQVWPATIAATDVHAGGHPSVVLHSDVHIGNWYRNGNGGMGLCDWQCVTAGHWARDVSYCLSAALMRDDRQAWERELLARYLDRLGSIAGETVPFDVAFLQYRRQMMHALWMWTITLCHSPLLPAMQPRDTTLEMIARIAGAMEDLDSIDAALAGTT